MKKRKSAERITFCAAFVALLVVCAMISVPSSPPFTMQSFAVFLTAALLPLSYALSVYLAYLCLGALGLPVFSSFTGGLGSFVGPTGGYLFGFILCIAAVRLVVSRLGLKKKSLACAFSLGSAVLYTAAALYYSAVSLGSVSISSVAGAFAVCVLPFIPFDAVKLILAAALALRLERQVPFEKKQH